MNSQTHPSCYIKLETQLAEEADAVGIDVEQAAREGVRAALLRLRRQAAGTPPEPPGAVSDGTKLVQLSEYRQGIKRLSD